MINYLKLQRINKDKNNKYKRIRIKNYKIKINEIYYE